jgi:DNA-directed RNA polymerase subunit D
MVDAGRKAEKEEGGSNKMDIRLLEKNDDQKKMSFILKGTNANFANLLRRYIVERVYTMAIEDIELNDNSSILYDEIVAHRLGLITLTTDLKSYFPINKCKCDGKGCNRCTLKLTLKEEGPGIVYASSIKSKDPKVKPVFGKTPIVKLLKDQKIELIATAVLGQGCDHAKFSPGFAFYKFKPDIKIIKNPQNSEEIAKSCPVDVFDFKDNTISVNKDNLMKCHLCNQCVEIADGAVEIEGNQDIIFNVESWGQLDCREMVLSALDEFSNDLDEFEKLLK